MGEINKTVFITGATGFVGSYLLKELLARLGPQSKIFVFSRKHIDCPDTRVANIIGGLEDIEEYATPLKESNYVYHLAADATFGNDIDYHAVNTVPTQKIADILKESTVLKNFIFVSTIGALDRHYDDRCEAPLNKESIPSPTSAYGKSKLAAEEYIKKSGLPYTIVRPTWVYGRNMRVRSHLSTFVSMVHSKSPVIKFNFPGHVSLIHVEDLAFALANIIDNASTLKKTYIAETEALSIGKIFSTFYEHIKGEAPKQIPIPRFSFLFSRFHAKLPLTVVNLFLDYLRARDEDFRRELLANRTTFKLEEKAIDVIGTHISVTGFWLVTGANSGIGYELACRLHAAGKKLILVDKELTNLTGFGNQMILPVDLSDKNQVSMLLKKIEGYRMFALINNAGIGFKGDFTQTDATLDEKVVAVNISAPITLAKALLPTIIKNNGAIVNMASSAAYNPLPGMAVYAASKSFLLNWSLSLWYEMRKKCLIVTCSPSGTNTNFQKKAGVADTAKLLSAEVVARTIYNAIRARKPFLFIGFKNKIFIWLTRFLPAKFNVVLWGNLFKKLR